MADVTADASQALAEDVVRGIDGIIGFAKNWLFHDPSDWQDRSSIIDLDHLVRLIPDEDRKLNARTALAGFAISFKCIAISTRNMDAVAAHNAKVSKLRYVALPDSINILNESWRLLDPLTTPSPLLNLAFSWGSVHQDIKEQLADSQHAFDASHPYEDPAPLLWPDLVDSVITRTGNAGLTPDAWAKREGIRPSEFGRGKGAGTQITPEGFIVARTGFHV